MDKISFEYKGKAVALKSSNAIDDSTNFIYRILFPESLCLRKKKHIGLSNSYKNNTPSMDTSYESKRRRRGRPRKDIIKTKNIEQNGRNSEDIEQSQAVESTALSRTRSGRVTRPPRHMSKFIEMNDNDKSTDKQNNLNGNDLCVKNQTIKQQCRPAKDLSVNTTKELKIQKIGKKLDRFKCGICKKVKLGEEKMLKHLEDFPDHKDNLKDNYKSSSQRIHKRNITHTTHSYDNSCDSFLFDKLLKEVYKTNINERSAYFLSQLTNFVTKMRFFKESLLANDNSNENLNSRVNYVNRHVCNLLDIPEGNHYFNESAFDEPKVIRKVLDQTKEIQPDLLVPASDYSMPCITEVNYDHISDNAVEAGTLASIVCKEPATSPPLLDISLELFQFNST